MKSIPQLRKELNDTQLKLFAAEAEIKRLRSLPPVEVVREVKVPVQVVKVVERDVPGPERIVYKEGPERVVVKRVEVPVEKVVVREKKVEVPVERVVIKENRVEVPVQVIKVVEKPVEVVREVIKEVPGPTNVKTVIKEGPERIVHVDRPIDVPRLVTKTVTVEKDSDATIAKLKKARAEIKRLKAELEDARTAVTIREVIKEVPVVEYRDNPRHIEMIMKLRGGK